MTERFSPEALVSRDTFVRFGPRESGAHREVFDVWRGGMYPNGRMAYVECAACRLTWMEGASRNPECKP